MSEPDYIKRIMLNKLYLKGMPINDEYTGKHVATVEKVTSNSIYMRSVPLNYLMRIPRDNVYKPDPKRIKLYRDAAKNHIWGILQC